MEKARTKKECDVTFEQMIQGRGQGFVRVNINGVHAGRIVRHITGDFYAWIPDAQTFPNVFWIDLVEYERFTVLHDETEQQTLARAKTWVETRITTALTR
tara:strand:- start:84 stop:383 length:300 start_codon:yes stop_codon:yes gene_type:complete